MSIYELYCALVKKVTADKDEDMYELIDDAIMAFPKYVNVVYRETVMIPINRFRLEGEDLREALEKLDRDRRLAHEVAISSCNILNRICDRYEVERFCIDAESADRYQVGDFCARIVAEIFQKGTETPANLDDMVKTMTGSMQETVPNMQE